jgi:hypothetical protein
MNSSVKRSDEEIDISGQIHKWRVGVSSKVNFGKLSEEE